MSVSSPQTKELKIKKQYNDTVRIQTRQYKALQKQMIASLPKERRREILKQSREEQLRKTHMLTLQYEKTIADMSQLEAVSTHLNTQSILYLCMYMYSKNNRDMLTDSYIHVYSVYYIHSSRYHSFTLFSLLSVPYVAYRCFLQCTCTNLQCTCNANTLH